MGNIFRNEVVRLNTDNSFVVMLMKILGLKIRRREKINQPSCEKNENATKDNLLNIIKNIVLNIGVRLNT